MPARRRKPARSPAPDVIFKASFSGNCPVSSLLSDWSRLSGRARRSAATSSTDPELADALDVLHEAVTRRALHLHPCSKAGALAQAKLIDAYIRAAAIPARSPDERERLLRHAATGLRHLTDYLAKP
jgi:hypothetical protein